MKKTINKILWLAVVLGAMAVTACSVGDDTGEGIGYGDPAAPINDAMPRIVGTYRGLWDWQEEFDRFFRDVEQANHQPATDPTVTITMDDSKLTISRMPDQAVLFMMESSFPELDARNCLITSSGTDFEFRLSQIGYTADGQQMAFQLAPTQPFYAIHFLRDGVEHTVHVKLHQTASRAYADFYTGRIYVYVNWGYILWDEADAPLYGFPENEADSYYYRIVADRVN